MDHSVVRRLGRVAILACAGAWGLWGQGDRARGDMAVETWAVGQDGGHPATVTVLSTQAGAGVIRANLSALPAGAKVYRARLLVKRKPPDPTGPDALARCEVYPLAGPFQEGKTPRAAKEPLALAPPAYDCFDAAEAVRSRSGDTCDFLVKSLPGWLPDSTRLEIAYEGKASQTPAQAGGVQVFHKAGQTFITWKETDPLVASEKVTWGEIKRKLAEAKDPVTCRVYAHGKPITAATVSEARLLAEVGPLSGYNCNGRNMEYLIGQAMAQPDEMGELARDYNGHMYTWGMDSPRMDRCPVQRLVIDAKAGPLPVGTGLYVHHPASAGECCYAVTACKGGRENTADFAPANAPPKPVAETVGLGEPVHQGPGLWGPFFDYPGRRQVYVQWCAPPLSPAANMYFNWSVLVPPGAEPGQKAPLELYFHSGNFSYAKPRQKYILGSVQIAPHDWPFSGWYGFNEAFGTLRSPRDAKVSNHTQRRIAAFLDWAQRRFPIDPDRIVLTGGDGAVMLALQYPDKFAYVLVINFEEYAIRKDRHGTLPAAWGPQSPDVKDDQARANWGWAMLDELVLAARGRDLPLIFCRGYSWGPLERKFARGEGRFYDAMRRCNQPIIADWTWAQGYMVPPDRYTGLWRGMDVTRTTPVPAFANCSTDNNTEGDGQTNLPMTWQPARQTPDAVEVVVTNSRREATVDLTLRRLSEFKVRPGEKLTWQGISTPLERRPRETVGPQGGTVVVDDDGVFVIKGLKVTRDQALNVKVTRAK